MGLCPSRVPPPSAFDLARRKEIQTQRRKIEEEAARTTILIVGDEGAGSSTLFQQFKFTYGNDSKEDLSSYVPEIHRNVILAIQTLCLQVEQFKSLPEAKSDFPLKEENLSHYRAILALDSNSVLNMEIAQSIKALWSDPLIQRLFALRSSFELNYWADYLLDNVERYSETGFVPAQPDVLKCRLRNRGVEDAIVNVRKNQIRVIDSSGEKNKWRKWIHPYDLVTAVIFVVSLSADDYRTTSKESSGKFLGDSLNTFEELASVFRSSHMIVVLNKQDLFESQLKQTPLSRHFPDFQGKNSPYEEYQFISSMFLAKDTKHDVMRDFLTYWTNATDEDCAHVLSAITETTLRTCRGFGANPDEMF
jgi:guanine nucleotide-binding protein G(i) subunit alpha